MFKKLFNYNSLHSAESIYWLTYRFNYLANNCGMYNYYTETYARGLLCLYLAARGRGEIVAILYARNIAHHLILPLPRRSILSFDSGPLPLCDQTSAFELSRVQKAALFYFEFVIERNSLGIWYSVA